ncbi:MAG: response regulator transcription factor [Anaerolineae bacterium]|jgi:two-component system, NarL family, response regulator LiaR|nr:response regulator transcription factor [Anaerolineae bacterium]MBT7073157.1 response regulator transcription factor [Anaerolineae bacterium]MBT7326617.1 response regulator transcription factor [Anaerolineae bacterium]
MNPPVRVLVVDDQAVVRQGLVAILSYQEDIEVIGQAKNGFEAIHLIPELSPDVVLLDLVMPELDGLQTIPEILTLAPETHILVVTGYGDAERVYQAIKSGALGYILKDTPHEELIKAIHEVSRGEAFIPPSIALRMIRESNQLSPSVSQDFPLTPREVETLKHIAQGLTNQDIATELVVHERTIAKYVSNILSKLHLANRTQAALYALRKGLSDLDEDE